MSIALAPAAWAGGAVPYFALGRPNRVKPLGQAFYRPQGGALQPVPITELLSRLAQRLIQVRTQTWNSAAAHGRGLGFLIGGDLTNEEGYLWAKLARLSGAAHLELEQEAAYGGGALALESTFGYPAAPNHWSELNQANTLVLIGRGLSKPHPLYGLPGLPKPWVITPGVFPAAAAQVLTVKPGTELALLGGWIRHIFQQRRWDSAFINSYTNGSYLLSGGLTLAQGVFSGLHNGHYQPQAWSYLLEENQPVLGRESLMEGTVLQLVSDCYAPYTISRVSAVTGIDPVMLAKFYEGVTDPLRRPLAVAYNLEGENQPFTEQIVRAVSLIQLLTGQLGQPGLGVVSLATAWNAQGLMDVGANGVYLPGYSGRVPRVGEDYLAWFKANGGQSFQRLQGVLKAWFGEQVNQAPDYGFHWLPKSPTASLRASVSSGQTKFLWGLTSDPVALGWDLRKLESLCLLTSDSQSPALRTPGPELFVLPIGEAPAGTITDTGRRIIWQVGPKNPIAPDPIQLADRLWGKLSKLWSTSPDSSQLEQVPWNSQRLPEELVSAVAIYRGLRNQADPSDNGAGIYPGYGWSWPNNIRVLGNRTSADLSGQPRLVNRPFLKLDETSQTWQGPDVPDLASATDSRPFPQTPEGVARLVTVEWRGGLNLDTGIAARVLPQPYLGPLPIFYWPWGSTQRNPFYPNTPVPPVNPF